jgi:histidinol phosphatase-like PHP family hydrolase
MFHRALPDELSPAAYMRHHLDNLEQLAAEMPVDILSHPTLVPIPLRNLPVDELWTDELEQRLVDALYHAEIAFEISNRYRPHERLVKRAHERGVQLSLGSDGHTREQVGDLAFPLEMARRVGAEESTLFDPFVHGTRAAR